MKKVYVVTAGSYSSVEVIGVYDTEEAAKAVVSYCPEDMEYFDVQLNEMFGAPRRQRYVVSFKYTMRGLPHYSCVMVNINRISEYHDEFQREPMRVRVVVDADDQAEAFEIGKRRIAEMIEEHKEPPDGNHTGSRATT